MPLTLKQTAVEIRAELLSSLALRNSVRGFASDSGRPQSIIEIACSISGTLPIQQVEPYI